MGRIKRSRKTEVILIRCSPETAKRFRETYLRMKIKMHSLTYEDLLNIALDYLERYYVEGKIS